MMKFFPVDSSFDERITPVIFLVNSCLFLQPNVNRAALDDAVALCGEIPRDVDVPQRIVGFHLIDNFLRRSAIGRIFCRLVGCRVTVKIV